MKPPLGMNSVVRNAKILADDVTTDITLLRQTLDELKEEMLDRIDGASDGPAFDFWLTEKIAAIEWALKETK